VCTVVDEGTGGRRPDAGRVRGVPAQMYPTPSFAVRDGYAVYRGPVGADGPGHRHAAFQIVIAGHGEVAMVDSSGTRHQGAALLVPPMVPHRILSHAQLLTYFIDPHCAFADRLRRDSGSGLTVAPSLCELRESDIGPDGGGPSRALDPRLVDALQLIQADTITLPDVAAAVGLSPQRLRSLARRELGIPLTRWRIWSRLRRAVDAVQSGASVADAALAAGFADQAHLTRQMREMVGLTPAAVLPALRGTYLRAT
jgi:AraC-like DNA-binding protein